MQVRAFANTKLSWRNILTEAVQKLAENGVPDSEISAEFILAKTLNIKRNKIHFYLDEVPGDREIREFESLIARRIAREPLQYILGEWEFMGLNFRITPDVFIPRPETEILVEEAIKFIGNSTETVRGLEIGVGCGSICCAILHFVSNCEIVGTDISLSALEVAKENSRRLKVENRLRLLRSDVFENVTGRFDFIISNPPYVTSEYLDRFALPELGFEPRIALDGGSDGLRIIARIIEGAKDYLVQSGALFLEIGYDEPEKVMELANGIFRTKSIIPDLAGIPRVFKGQL